MDTTTRDGQLLACAWAVDEYTIMLDVWRIGEGGVVFDSEFPSVEVPGHTGPGAGRRQLERELEAMGLRTDVAWTYDYDFYEVMPAISATVELGVDVEPAGSTPTTPAASEPRAAAPGIDL